MAVDCLYGDVGGRYGIVIVISAFMIQFFTFGMAQSIGIYNIEFLDSFDTTAAAVSLIGAINLGVLMGAGPLVSYLMNKFGYREVALAGSVLSTLGLVCVPFVSTLPALYVFYGFFTGLGYSMAYIPSHVMSGLYCEKHRSLATAVATSGSGLGAVFFPILVQYLIEEYSWQGSFFVIAGLNVQNCVFAALLKPLSNTTESKHSKTKTVFKKDNEPENKITNGNNFYAEGATKHVTKKTLCVVFFNFKFLIFLINNVTWNMGLSVILVFGAEYSIITGLGKESASQIVMFSSLGMFCGCILGGILGNISYFNRIYVYNVGAIVAGATNILFMAETLHTFIGFAVLYFVWGCGFGIIIGLLVVILADILSVDHLGDGMGYLMFFNGVGCLVGPPVAGYLSDVFGRFDLVLYFSGFVTVLAGVLMLAIPVRSRCKSTKQKKKIVGIATIDQPEVFISLDGK